jgi:predicted PurR-regulated permease PerM
MIDAPKIRNVLFFGLMALVLVVFLFIMKPFFFPIFWAAVIASVFRPIYKKIHGKISNPDVSCILVVVLILLIILLPAGIIGSLTISESVDLYSSMDKDNNNVKTGIQNIFTQFTHHPTVQKLRIDEQIWIEKFTEATKAVANYLLASIRSLTENALIFFVKFGVMLYALYFFIRDGDKFLKMLIRYFPLGGGREEILLQKFKTTALATLKVTLIIGGIQGMLGGFIFFITGISGSMMWGIIMVLTSIIPSIGCSIIWAPAAVIMLVTGHTWQGIAILLFGLLVISTVDQLLRPFLLGKDVQMHPLMIFLSTLGGIMLFGISGFVIGPIVCSLFLAILEMYEQYYTSEMRS